MSDNVTPPQWAVEAADEIIGTIHRGFALTFGQDNPTPEIDARLRMYMADIIARHAPTVSESEAEYLRTVMNLMHCRPSTLSTLRGRRKKERRRED